ncbi:MAG: hypothetical protein PQJ61_08205 [Spirochaetales bacterium]|uniref:DUF4432 family protein n=1 Tax=Candidatus Thalassospirochaeta sargassi TaxID=3119039 RepID=A0AAJ1IF96_9SPIO|nr:hypothetical protein [Spirochaetales bacterium]
MSGELKTEIISGQKSWLIENKNMKLYMTEFAGHMAPVTFFRDTDNAVEPFYINPWAEEDIDMSSQPGCLKPLRGDFFCLPFGGDNSWNGENHPPHGDVQEGTWSFEKTSESGGITEAVFTFDMITRPGRVVKTVRLIEGQNVLYTNDSIEGFAGPACPGHHAIFPGGSSKYISMGPFKTGFTAKSPANGCGGDEYYALESFTEFSSLKKVPTRWKNEPYTDCSVFPAREGFIDILQVRVDETADFAWTAAVVPEEGYLWFALKNPEVLPSTVMWMENKGRHGIPWKGRNCCIGIEDVCCYLADGLKVSAEENELTKRGFTTTLNLDGKSPLDVKYIQGLVRIPDGFDRVADIRKSTDGIELISESGKSVKTFVDTGFIS